jgi:predicted DCC family thiol-disulfide oxidoreductase YuxK
MQQTGGPGMKEWMLYDADCAFCVMLARLIEESLARRGVGIKPLQDAWSRVRLAGFGVAPEHIPDEVRVITADDRLIGGGDAFVYLARKIWWTWPLWLFSKLPGGLALIRVAYRFVAKHRGALVISSSPGPKGQCENSRGRSPR